MPANFPNSPTTNQLYSYNGATWKWTGAKWQLVTVANANTGTLFTYSNAVPQSPSLGDRWLNSETLRQSIYINDGDTDQWVEPVSIGMAGATKSLNNLSNVAVNTDLIPGANLAYDLGTNSLRWRDLYLSGNSIRLGAATLSSTGTAVNLPAGTTVGGQNVATTGEVSTGGGPKISNIQITNSSWTVLDDTAVDTAGGHVLVTGTNFVAGCLVYFNQTPANSVAFVGTTSLRVAVPALAAGTYIVYVINPDGGTAIRVPGLTASASPAWQTASGLPDQYDNTAITLSLVAADATGYTLTSGSLPPGLSLNTATGIITGTVTTVTVDTTYTFTITATDAQLQDSPRTFTVTITVSDAYFRLTTLLLSGEQGNTVVRDSSVNNFNLTAFGDSRATNFTPYGTGWSAYFDGTGDYLSVPDNEAFTYSNLNWTIEAWVYRQTSGSRTIICGQADGVDDNYTSVVLEVNASNQLAVYCWVGATNHITTATVTLESSLWYHVAAVRNSSTITLYQNGIAVGSISTISTSAINNSPWIFAIGRAGTYNSLYWNGYISNFRLVKGTAVYTANFIPPTAPLTAIANTSLLTCHTNRFLDGSTNNFAITRNGDVAVRSFNPFGITNTGDSGSMYFDGTGDYVTAANNANIDIGTGDFSIEAWCYKTNTSTASDWKVMGGSASGSGFFGNGGTNSSTGFGIGRSGVAWDLTSNVQAPIMEWFHICYTRKSGAVRIFLNGKLIAYAASNTNNYGLNAGTLQITAEGGSYSLTGYMADFRLFKTVPASYDTAVTTTNTQVFTPPTTAVTAIANTQLLTLQYRQPHNNHGFQDASSNQLIITRLGNASQGTFSPFSQTGWSVYINNDTSSQIRIADNAGLRIGTSAFTIESWVYPTGFNVPFYILRKRAYNGIGTGTWAFTVSTNGAVLLEQVQGPATIAQTSTGLVSLNNWTHVAVSRDDSNNVKIFVNGTVQATATSSYDFNDASNPISLLCDYDTGTRSSIGYASNLRFVIGSALYTANFTPSTSPLTTTSQGATAGNVKLLTCQDNRFRDASTNNFTITTLGSPSVVAFSPFAPTQVYSPAVHGGSAYFDGTGDYLEMPAGQNWNFGTGAFTCEAWVYPALDEDNTYTLFAISRNTSNEWAWAVTTGNNWGLYWYWGNYGANQTERYTSQYPIKGQWNHIAVSRDTSFTWRFYINGILIATSVFNQNTGWDDARSFNNVGINPRIGESLKGYISDFRVIKGTALYTTSTITLPTAPLTSTTDTQLLLNFTDAAIVDRTGRTVVETVADAKTSSVQVKYGTGSIYLDGNEYLISPSTELCNFGTGNFTVELWVYQLSIGSGSYYHFFSINSQNTFAFKAHTTYYLYANSGTAVATTGFAPLLNQWVHLALVRSENALKIFVNGIERGSGSTTSGTSFGATGRLWMGSASGTTGEFAYGYFQNLRITRFARYTANFTPPTGSHRLK